MSYNWKDERNYRRFQMPDGSVRCLIFIDGQSVEVDEKLFREYAKMDRSERYSEECREDTHLSLERFAEDELSGEYLCDSYQDSAEDYVLDKFNSEERMECIGALRIVLPHLTKAEQTLIHALYFDTVSLREYARKLGITHRALQKQRDRILQKIKNLLIFQKLG